MRNNPYFTNERPNFDAMLDKVKPTLNSWAALSFGLRFAATGKIVETPEKGYTAKVLFDVYASDTSFAKGAIGQLVGLFMKPGDGTGVKNSLLDTLRMDEEVYTPSRKWVAYPRDKIGTYVEFILPCGSFSPEAGYSPAVALIETGFSSNKTHIKAISHFGVHSLSYNGFHSDGKMDVDKPTVTRQTVNFPRNGWEDRFGAYHAMYVSPTLVDSFQFAAFLAVNEENKTTLGKQLNHLVLGSPF